MFSLKQKKKDDFKSNLENEETLSRQQEIEQEEKTRAIAREKAENELKKEKEQKDLKTGVIGCIVLVAIIVLISIFSSGGKDKNPVNWAEQDNSTMAYIKAENFVKQNLKSPSSADFPGVLDRDGHVIKGEDHKYLIN
ncbi:MAG TPA: hypothetical protein PK142_03155, partial [bacterium]|nr:hypothetical protein [bacterium]